MATETDIEVPDGWTVDHENEQMVVEVQTEDFLEALDLFDEIAEIAEEQVHHPDLHLEEYNQVTITTWSHDVGGLTERDERLANAITQVLTKRGLL